MRDNLSSSLTSGVLNFLSPASRAGMPRGREFSPGHRKTQNVACQGDIVHSYGLLPTSSLESVYDFVNILRRVKICTYPPHLLGRHHPSFGILPGLDEHHDSHVPSSLARKIRSPLGLAQQTDLPSAYSMVERARTKSTHGAKFLKRIAKKSISQFVSPEEAAVASS
jgi:hypothetical protein